MHPWLTIFLALATTSAIGGILFISFLVTFAPKPRPSTPPERQYVSQESDEPKPLPNLDDPATLSLSVIVPAYNETERLPGMLDEALEYLEKRRKSSIGTKRKDAGGLNGNARANGDASHGVVVVPGSYEVLIVDDGSKDGTPKLALEYAKKNVGKGGEFIKVVKLEKNRGKGGAVRHGMLHCAGERQLFVDADGASKFSDFGLLEKEMDGARVGAKSEEYSMVVGSRAHLVKTAAVVKRSFVRNLLMRSFHLYLQLLSLSSIRDTQCGFKLFSRPLSRLIFPTLHVERWIFDIEIILLAELLDRQLPQGVKISEVGVTWQEVSGSKVDLIRDSLKMASDLLVIRVCYAIGKWTVPSLAGEHKGGKVVKGE